MNANVISNAAKLAAIATIVTLAGVTVVYANGSDTQPTYSGNLPSMTVVKQWSNVRARPEVAGDIIDSLALGSQIRVLDIVNKWIWVRYNDGNISRTGFMHQSLLGYFSSSSDDRQTEVNFTEDISSSVRGIDL